MGATLTLVPDATPQRLITRTAAAEEKFELLVFDRYGSLYIQTNTGWYFFATAYWYAAKVLHRLLNGIEVEGVMSYPEHRVLNSEQRNCCLYIDAETVRKSHSVDLVESDWPGVTAFFRLYRERRE